MIEVLVGVAAMSALAAILVPAFAGVQEAAASVQCRGALRQWALAARLYADRNDSCLPRRGQGVQPTAIVDRPEDWFNALPPLMAMPTYAALAAKGQAPRAGGEAPWICPRAQEADGANFFAYGMNMRLSTWMAGVPDRMNRIDGLEVQVFMADGPGPHCSVLPSAKTYSPAARHGGGVNVMFLDGHGAEFAGEYAGCGTGDPGRPEIRWRVPGSAWPGPGE